MSQIIIKIVEIDLSTQSVVVKFASENSKKSIDDYDGLSFHVPNYDAITPEQFIELLRPQISQLVQDRDSVESRTGKVDIESWIGYTTTVESVEVVNTLVDPYRPDQIVTALSDSEVIL